MQSNSVETFADRLRSLIAAQPLTKKALAEKAGMHPVSLSKYLSGKRIPATEELHALASILKVTSSHLLTGDNSQPANIKEVERLGESSVMREDPTFYNAAPPAGGWERMFLKAVRNATTDWLIESLVEFNKTAEAGDAASGIAVRMIADEIRSRAVKPSEQNKSQ